MNLIFTCGGTAGHINPALAVANMMRQRHPDCKILFIGAQGHMEEKLVPQAGYELKTLPGSGLSRRMSTPSSACWMQSRNASGFSGSFSPMSSSVPAATPASRRCMPVLP